MIDVVVVVMEGRPVGVTGGCRTPGWPAVLELRPRRPGAAAGGDR
jgi:hypothetical protein